MKHIRELLSNKWVQKCGGPWGSLVVLAAEPKQEDVTDIKDFLWQMCVSYWGLNRITEPFTFPITRCDDSINQLGEGSMAIFFITLDAHQGYHQIMVRLEDQEKLAFLPLVAISTAL